MTIMIVLAGLIALAAVGGILRKRALTVYSFSFAVIVALLWAVFGASPAMFLVHAALLLAIFAASSLAFREVLGFVLPERHSRTIRKAPLTAAFGMLVISIYAVSGIFAPFIAPFGEAEIVASAFSPADDKLLFGADQLGRDIFSRVIFGARNSVGIALAATVLAFLVGALAGLAGAVHGRFLDLLLGRSVDFLMSIPSLIFALLMLSIFGTSILSIVVVIAVIYSPRVYRLTRAVAGNVVVMDFVEASKLRGEGSWYIVRRDVLPNITAPLVAEFGLEFCFVFLLVAGLSFLGLGVQPPTADWGAMVRENATLISFGEFTPLIPAVAISLLAVAVNFVVDWMLHQSSGLKD